MDIAVKQLGAASVVAISGEIDISTAAQLETTLLELVASDLILDLSDTTFLDSTAIGVLVGVDKQLRAAGHRMKIACPNPQLFNIFKISRLDTVWSIADSIDQFTRGL